MSTAYPLVPRRLPDGRTVWEEKGKAKDVLDAIRHYDPRVSIVRNHTDGSWEIWRKNEDESQARVAIFLGDFLPEPSEAVKAIAEHDTWRGYDPLADLFAKEAARVKAEDEAAVAVGMKNVDRLHYELVDEFSAHAPAARPIPLAPKRGRRRVNR